MPPSSACGSLPRGPRTGSSASSRVTGSGSGTGLVWSNPTLSARAARSQSTSVALLDRHGAQLVAAAVAAPRPERGGPPADGVDTAYDALATDLAQSRLMPQVE